MVKMNSGTKIKITADSRELEKLGRAFIEGGSRHHSLSIENLSRIAEVSHDTIQRNIGLLLISIMESDK